MNPTPDAQIETLQTELEELRTAKATSDKALEDLKLEKAAHTKEKQVWIQERRTWEVEKAPFAKQKRSWDAEKRARALEKEFDEEHQTLHSHFMQMIQGINNATAGMVGERFNFEDGGANFIDVMSEEMIQQQTTDEQDRNVSEKEKCMVIIGNVRQVGKQWLDCVEAAAKEDPEFVISVEDVQARLDQAAELLEMMEDSEEPISEV